MQWSARTSLGTWGSGQKGTEGRCSPPRPLVPWSHGRSMFSQLSVQPGCLRMTVAVLGQRFQAVLWLPWQWQQGASAHPLLPAQTRRWPHAPFSALQVAMCDRSSRRVIPEPEARGTEKPPPARLSRVNGWSLPLHVFQGVAWITFTLMAVACFGIFIPLLSQSWKYTAYCVSFPSGGSA